MAYSISDYFESESISQHYKDRRSLAAAYLSTMGSKALALTKLTNSVSLKGLDYEAACAHEVIRNRFKSKLCGPIGLLVYKRARNGDLRALQIRLKSCGKQGDYIEWQSKKMFGRRKFFCLNNLTYVERCSNEGPEETDEPLSRISPMKCSIASFSSRTVDDAVVDWPAKNDRTVPFISFRNSTRKLDLKFETLQETLVCMDLIKRTYISAPASISSST